MDNRPDEEKGFGARRVCMQCSGHGVYTDHAPDCDSSKGCTCEGVQVACEVCIGQGWIEE